MNENPVRNVVRDAVYPLKTNNIVLYSGTTCPLSHRCRIVLFEKQMDFQLIDVDLHSTSEDAAAHNPYATVPTFVHRDLVLHQANIINEYLDERFPHPQLMPTDIQDRAKARQLLHTMDRELYSHVNVLENDLKSADKSRAHLSHRLSEMSGLFGKQKYLFGNDFSMLDVALAPLLWRLEHYRIQLPKTAEPLLKYAEMVFSRQGFMDSLTPSEKIMRR